MSAKSYEHLIFDLDDTLLDTFGQLIPPASREACLAMIEAGLDTQLDEALKRRDALVLQGAKTDLYGLMVAHFGVRDGSEPTRVARAGYMAFHNRRVETNIALFPGALEMLRKLRSKSYGLHLVTSGHQPTQREKVRILGLDEIFLDIQYVDPMKRERKNDAFRQIMAATRASPEKHLSIGNRLDTDIGPARELGWRACWVCYGEYAHHRPATKTEEPDFIVSNVSELIEKCRL